MTCPGRSAARARAKWRAADPGPLRSVAVPDQRCTATQELRAAPHPGHEKDGLVMDIKGHAAVVTGGAARILINCAGVGQAKRIVGRDVPMPLAEFERVININLIGTFNMMRLVAADMQSLSPLADGERGVIIMTASVAAFEGQIGQAAYSASKGGVAALTLPAAREFAQFGIRVNTIAPGIFHTPMLMALPEEAQKSLAAAVPFPKLLGRPDQFAALARHIIENTYINGEVIRLDGALRLAPR